MHVCAHFNHNIFMLFNPFQHFKLLAKVYIVFRHGYLNSSSVAIDGKVVLFKVREVKEAKI